MIKCFLGFHKWKRSRFVALNERTAGFICDRCHRWKDGETNLSNS